MALRSQIHGEMLNFFTVRVRAQAVLVCLILRGCCVFYLTEGFRFSHFHHPALNYRNTSSFVTLYIDINFL